MASLTLDERGVVVPCPSCGRRNRLAFGRLDASTRCGSCKATLGPPASPAEVPSAAVFDAMVAGSALPVVVDYWAPWCGPCRTVAPEFEQVAAAHAGRILLAKVNTERLPELAARYAIRSIPTLAVFSGGRQVASEPGARPAPEIERFVLDALR